MNGSTIDAIVRANGRVTMWLARIAAFALALIAVVTFCDVIGRYFFHAPFAFTVELTSFAMAVIVFFGVGLVTHEDAHISADVVTLRLPPRLRALFAVVTNLLALGFLALMAWPLWPVALAVAFGSLFLLTGVLLLLIGAWRRLMGAEPPPAPVPPGIPYRE